VRAVGTLIDPAEVARRLAEGQTCLVGWIGDQPAHCRWDTSAPAYLDYLGLTLHPQPGQVYSLMSYSPPRYRRRGLNSAATILALHEARERGYRTGLVIMVQWDAITWHVSAGVAGRTVVGTIGYWNLLLWRRYFASGKVRLKSWAPSVVGAGAAPARTLRPTPGRERNAMRERAGRRTASRFIQFDGTRYVTWSWRFEMSDMQEEESFPSSCSNRSEPASTYP
jgi:hypothetical protein